MFNPNTGNCVKSLDTESQVCALEWSRNGKELMSAHGYSSQQHVVQNRLVMWSYPTMKQIVQLSGPLASLVFDCPRSHCLAIRCRPQRARVAHGSVARWHRSLQRSG